MTGLYAGEFDFSAISPNSTMLTGDYSSFASSLTSGAGKTGISTADVGLATGIAGALQSIIGAYSTASSIKDNFEFQSRMTTINARLAEKTAQSVLRAGESQAGRVSLRSGQIKSSQKVSQAGRGITIGEGSAAEETASTDLIKEMDMNTIYENAVNASNAARMQSVNYTNSSLMQDASAKSLNPYMAGSTSLITAGTTVASTWYRNQRADALADALGLN